MFGQTLNHDTIRKIVIYFGSLFNNIVLDRFDSTGAIAQNMLVPLNYGPKEKFLARAEGDPNLDRQIATTLPRMSFNISSLNYDSSRKINTLNKIMGTNSITGTTAAYQYAPAPYNIGFNLFIMVKNAADGTAIIEQILPYFSPSWSAKVNLNPDLGQSYDMPIFLNDVSAEDTYEGDFISRRHLIWTLSFTVQGWLFGPTMSGGKIINTVNINFDVPPAGVSIGDAISTVTDSSIEMQIVAGLNGNNQPVNWYGAANSAPSSLSANTIAANSNYGYIVDFMKDG